KDYPSYASMAAVAGGIFGVLYAGTGSTTGPANDALIEAIRRASRGDAPAAPPGASGAALKMYEELARVSDEMRVHEAREKQTVADTREAVQALDELLKKLGDGVTTQLSASEETARSIKDMTSALRDIAQHVEVLASSAEESSSSILEMTATNDEVAENIGELASSVRETVSSIEEMAYSIKEVAKNVDALSLTAEETSSSMNGMDVSTDPVQTNANETA